MVKTEPIKTAVNKKNPARSSVILLNTSGLNLELQQKVIDFYNKQLDNPEIQSNSSYIQKIAFYKTIEQGFLGIFLYDIEKEKFLLNEGFFHNETPQLIKNYIHRLNAENSIETYPVYIGETLFELELRFLPQNSGNYAFGIIAQTMYNVVESINELEKYFTRYFFHEYKSDFLLCEYNYLPELNKSLSEFCRTTISSAAKIHLVLIEIESLAKYIKVAGDYLVNEIIKNVKDEINLIIKDKGKCFILNSHEYLIAISGQDEQSIKEKFGRAHFRVKNLLLVYQMKYFEISDFENGVALEAIWPKLKIY